ncbi:MAG TPA: copper chaperone PCu(A)C [Oxalicibacterium sp.]|jgi:copper(I)-binding protein|nr:copper chaperone PCu(A)C [Oxalicibacterium sp.]
MKLRSLFAVLLVAAATSAAAHAQHDQIAVLDPSFARASLPGQNNSAAYLSLQNKSAVSDTLLSISSPAAKEIEIHTMTMQDNVMRMREVPHIELPAGTTLTMQPGKGYHLMLMELKSPLKAGDKLPLVLRFQHAGTIETTVPVQESAAGMSMKRH